MAGLTAIIYVAVLLTAVLYSGGLSLHTIFGFDLTTSVWIVGAVAALYTTWGGLKAVAYADLLLGSGLLVGGMSIFAIGLNEHGGWSSFAARNAARLHMILPAEHPELPWTGVVGGMWIVILYYCGLNQFIVQRNLAARTLHDGQMGMVFAGGLWLLVPFAIVMPGIMAFSLYNSELAEIADKNNAKVLAQLEAFQASPDEHPPLIVEPDADWIARFPEQGRRIEAFNRAIQDRAQIGDVEPIRKRIAGYQSDAAFPTLVKNLIPVGMRGLIFAAIAGAVISSLASMLNSASTIVTMDLYKRLFAPRLEERRLVAVGRLLTLVFVVIACLMAPQLADPRFKGVFNFIQQFQGYIWPGVTAAFVMAFALPRAPGGAGVAALVAGPLFYGFFQFVWPLIPGVPQFHFLLQVLFTFLLVCAIMIGITLVAPLHEPRTLPERADMHAPNSRLAMALGAAVILGVFTIVVLFSW
jgi:SSS family solute:Na+ symporter